jgi:hypothetical protein
MVKGDIKEASKGNAADIQSSWLSGFLLLFADTLNTREMKQDAVQNQICDTTYVRLGWAGLKLNSSPHWNDASLILTH